MKNPKGGKIFLPNVKSPNNNGPKTQETQETQKTQETQETQETQGAKTQDAKTQDTKTQDTHLRTETQHVNPGG